MKKTKRKSGRYIPVAKGDIVSIANIAGNLFFKAEVLAVQERYSGWHGNIGSQKDAPLLTVKNLFTGEANKYDNSYVKVVIKKAKSVRSMPQNIFREMYADHPQMKTAIKSGKRGIAFGPLSELARIALSNLPHHLPLGINQNKLRKLYSKQRAGMIAEMMFGCYSVRWKAFSKWARRNAYKITQTVSDKYKEDEVSYQMLMDDDLIFSLPFLD